MSCTNVVLDAPSPFFLLDGIGAVGSESLTAWKQAVAMPFWLVLEAAAQAAALHQRWLSGFQEHAFLLSLGSCRWVEGAFSGCLTLQAQLRGQSRGAASYEVAWHLPDDAGASVSIHIGRCPYDATFRQESLQAHYGMLFQRLCHQKTAAKPWHISRQ